MKKTIIINGCEVECTICPARKAKNTSIQKKRYSRGSRGGNYIAEERGDKNNFDRER